LQETSEEGINLHSTWTKDFIKLITVIHPAFPFFSTHPPPSANESKKQGEMRVETIGKFKEAYDSLDETE